MVEIHMVRKQTRHSGDTQSPAKSLLDNIPRKWFKPDIRRRLRARQSMLTDRRHPRTYSRLFLNRFKCTSIFEKEKLSDDFYYSWEAFVKYLAALGGARDTNVGNNIHWADYWDECKPCNFHYDYITHLDQGMFKTNFWSIQRYFRLIKSTLGQFLNTIKRMKIQQFCVK